MDTSKPVPHRGAYLFINLISACAIVFANKAVFSVIQFRFTVTLTCIHTIATLFAAKALCAAGLIRPKKLPRRAVIALAAAFTGYIVLCNVSLAINTVGFYQLTKIAIAPAVMLMDACGRRRLPKTDVAICVLVVCFGVGLATVSDAGVMTNVPGLIVGAASVVASAQYGMWIGSMTKHHDVTPMQLLEQYMPYAAAMMAACVPVENAIVAFRKTGPTLTAFPYSVPAVGAIALSAMLGVMVTFSTFLVIGHTSPLTYAVAGHVKTVAILGGGVLIFGDSVTPVKAAGVVIALGGVVAYTSIQTASRTNRIARTTTQSDADVDPCLHLPKQLPKQYKG